MMIACDASDSFWRENNFKRKFWEKDWKVNTAVLIKTGYTSDALTGVLAVCGTTCKVLMWAPATLKIYSLIYQKYFVCALHWSAF